MAMVQALLADQVSAEELTMAAERRGDYDMAAAWKALAEAFGREALDLLKGGVK